MILVVDNYDSFTYNLVQYLGECRVAMEVVRNDRVSLDDIRRMAPERILISPGPGTPEDAGMSNDIIRHFGKDIPILGVCLGHQCIGYVFGAAVIGNYRLMHGKVSAIRHDGQDLFAGMPNPFTATRYHSLIVKRDTVPVCLEITAETEEGEVMGLRHRDFPIWGVQFHPESILTDKGRLMIHNFLGIHRHCVPVERRD